MNKNECEEKWVLLEMKGVQWRDKQGCSSKTGDKGRFGSYTKLCNFTLLFMILQVELRLNKDH